MRITLGTLFSVLFILSVPILGHTSQREIRAIESVLPDFFQLYMLRKDRRSDLDTVNVKELSNGHYSAEMSYWRSLKSRDPVEEICNAYRWLLFGRGTYGKGAKEAFERFSNLDEIKIRFFDIEFTTKIGKKRAEILPDEKVVPYLRVGVQRQSLAAKKPNWKRIQASLDKGQCAPVGDKYLDTKWFDKNYLRQGQ